jgi:hypothetical protein
MPFNSIFSWIMKKRVHQIELFKKFPVDVQQELFHNLVSTAAFTEYGLKYNFKDITNYEDFKRNVPLTEYDDLKPYIDRVIDGEQEILWPSETKWFAKSSGTTSSRSKLIPVTRESLEDCHYKGGKDLLSIYYNNYENRKLYNGKHLIVGGSAQVNYISDDSYFGDLSAIIVKNLPWWAEIKRTPAREIALMSEWEEKIEKMAQSTIEDDVYIIAGVPSWTTVLGRRVLEITGKKTLKEVWPNLELYMHGGVNFEPYREEFNKLMGFDDMHYVETYNASEGFFGIQDEIGNSGMLLMLDYGVFFEFIPMDSFNGTASTNVVSIEDVELGKQYALVISTNGGLWRYIVGDTIVFTQAFPYRFKISGRTKSYINTFGEEVIVENAEKAITMASNKTGAQVRDFHACPVYMSNTSKGAHQWLIEFVNEPNDLDEFKDTLDASLREINSDYDAKRYKDMVLSFPTFTILPKGGFDEWLKTKNKLGGQNKIPRLANNREIAEQILSVVALK